MADARPDSWSSIARRLGPAGPLAVVAAVMPALGGILLLVYINEAGVWLRSHGLAGVALYTAAFAVLAGLALLPTYAQAALGGWAFGLAIGFPAALAGFFGGAVIGYYVSRGASGDRVEALIREKPKWRAVRDALVGRGFWPTFGIVTLLRLPPNSPFALTNLVMASVRVPPAPFILGTLIGMAPRTGAVVALAAMANAASAADAVKERPPWLIPVGIGITIAVLLVIGHIANKAIAKVTAGAQSMGPPA